jgi:drug/metabolite transporter (DMT)-like permease
MLTVLVGLLSALVYGAADFLGGLAAKRIDPLRVAAVGGASGLVVLAAVLPVLGGGWSAAAVALGTLSGVSGAIALSLLYACLAIGPMSILSPLTAVVSAIVPLTVGVLLGERLTAVGYLALALALVAVVLVGFVPSGRAVRPSLAAVLMAIGAGAFIGGFLILIDLTPEDSGLVPLVANRITNAVLMFSTIAVLAVIRRQHPRGPGAVRGWRPGLVLAIACGVVDSTANILILVGLRLGDLGVMSMLTAMYPAGTIILAAVVLRERIAPTQVLGLVLALGAAALLALA